MKCVECGYEFDDRTAVDGSGGEPVPGNISICFSCNHIAIFDVDLSLREPTFEELFLIMMDKQVRHVLNIKAKVLAGK